MGKWVIAGKPDVMKIGFLLLTLCISLLLSCNRDKAYYPNGSFSAEPANLSDLNSAFNDYNSAGPPTIGFYMPFFFSSDRTFNPNGPDGNSVYRGKYDILATSLSYTFNLNTGTGTWNGGSAVPASSLPGASGFGVGLISRINTKGNELGPFIHYDKNRYSDLAMFASDSTGNLDIYFLAYPATCTDCTMPFPGKEVLAATRLNSPSDDAYPTLTADNRQLLFTSNRNGSFDLFSADLDGQSFREAFRTTAKSPKPVALLNSTADDKCPYINGSLLVFTSDRPGGYGGFDLYYSQWKNGQWSVPVNFGPAINTAADEYRPVPFVAEQFENNLMIFSSNRPGGKGGLDLYFVGIPKNLFIP